jgi:hypothetical protein
MLRIVICTAVVALLATAQPQVQEFRAELSAGFSSVQGRVILAGDRLIFIDETQPETSFYTDRADVQDISAAQDGGVTIQLARAIRDRGGERTRLTLRFPSQEQLALLRNWMERSPPASRSRTADAANVNELTYSAKHDKFMGGSSGRLILKPDRILYEALDDAKDSREWLLADIREIKLSNPYELRITPFAGDSYKLTLQGKGMAPEHFSRLQDGVAMARSRR